ncbi:immunity 53 family protein [Saccharothrix texasensis]|uniref:Immunity protein 53 of polymorphic toxin system n=1 Tax=Saccharothrix texasensis TaxID=103734 RepID=A0A3N1H3P5_9PSEU|nr:immunity 53 family protein [Saccharothrix texasensis]ROP37121.1 immunity protein 53 of polymorphic toxin system [Saccharothrix texasensis]
MDDLVFLQQWFSAHCDEDWEHGEGIKLISLDNPGWSLEVDLRGTGFEGRSMPRVKAERSETDWTQAWSDGRKFHAVGGAGNLVEVIGHFRAFVR